MDQTHDQTFDGIILIDKPAGMTSHDVVDRVRRIFHTRRVGHAGTLDPFATGLLILGVGPSTKKLTALVGLDKTYEATARLGATSNTYDLTGQITNVIPREVGAEPALSERIIISESNGRNLQNRTASEASSPPGNEEVTNTLMSFLGGYEQKAPAFSAKKVKGKKLYELARAGQDVEALRPTKKIDISAIELLDYNWPDLKFRVSCSSGTYIRSLAHDLGEKLGCGAYLTELRRTRIGEHKIEDAKKLEDLAH